MALAAIRPLRGSRQHNFYPPMQSPSLRSLDSAFQLQEYIALLIREDPHNISRIVSLPKASRGCNGSDDDRDDAVDESCWIYEHLRRLAQDLNYPLITTLQQDCTRESCPEMKAGEWLYLCVAHGTGGSTMEQCCAIDYILHTVDSATALLNSPRVFPSRISIPQSSHRHFSSLARRLGRIFAHAYFQHREAFEQAEAESSLYSRYLALTSIFELVPPDYLNIPARDGNPPTLQSASIEIGRSPYNEAISTSPSGGGRPRTDTMVFAENFSLRSEDDLDAYHSNPNPEDEKEMYDRGDTNPGHLSIYLPHSEEQDNASFQELIEPPSDDSMEPLYENVMDPEMKESSAIDADEALPEPRTADVPSTEEKRDDDDINSSPPPPPSVLDADLESGSEEHQEEEHLAAEPTDSDLSEKHKEAPEGKFDNAIADVLGDSLEDLDSSLDEEHGASTVSTTVVDHEVTLPTQVEESASEAKTQLTPTETHEKDEENGENNEDSSAESALHQKVVADSGNEGEE